ncbi:MAG TPA: MotA/TolQ/ExbB proton channel family protein, partial [Albitalea sp.]
MSLRHSLALRALFAVMLCAALAFVAPLPVRAQVSAPVAAAASDAAAPAPAAPAPLAASTTKETIDNPYGLSALWAQGDFVAKGTLIILVIMSMGSWYILITKLYES